MANEIIQAHIERLQAERHPQDLERLRSFGHLKIGSLDLQTQQQLLAVARSIIEQAPLFTPTMPHSGCPFNYTMTNCGEFGWVSSPATGYAYTLTQANGRPWPAMPSIIADLATTYAAAAGFPTFRPESCLINCYRPSQRLGMHQDTSEECDAPVISLSIGDTTAFQLGTTKRGDRTVIGGFPIQSGDVIILSGIHRYRNHAVLGLIPSTAPFPIRSGGGRINFTIRQVKP